MNSVMMATARDTSRNPSGQVWVDCPWNDIKEGRNNRIGYADHYDFTKLRKSTNINAAEAYWGDGLMAFGSDGGSIAELDADGGGATFAADGDNEGVGIRDAGQPFKLIQGAKAFWFEAALRTSTIADTKHGFFLGLMGASAITATSPITAAGAIADVNLVGFHRAEGDGDNLDIVYKADGVTAVNPDTDILDGSSIDGITLASALPTDTVFKLGMKYVPNGDKAGQYALSFYYNGTRIAASKLIPSAAGTDFPNDVRLGRVFSLLNATAATPGSTSLLWWRAAQLVG